MIEDQPQRKKAARELREEKQRKANNNLKTVEKICIHSALGLSL